MSFPCPRPRVGDTDCHFLLRASVSPLLDRPVSPRLPCGAGSLGCVRGWHEASGDPEGVGLGVRGGVVRRFPCWAGMPSVWPPHSSEEGWKLQGAGVYHGHTPVCRGSGVGFDLCLVGRPSFQPWLWLSPRELLGLRDTASAAAPGWGALASCVSGRALASASVSLSEVVLVLSVSDLGFSRR